MSTFVKAEEALRKNPIRMCLYGYNGVGKTTLAVESGMKTAYLALPDAGILTIRHLSNKDRLALAQPKSSEQFLEAVTSVNSKNHNVPLMVTDTLTGLQGICVREAKGKGDMSQRKWGQVTSRMIECISEVCLFSGDVLFLAQEKNKFKASVEDSAVVVEDEEDTGERSIRPSLTPSVREYLSSCVDWVGRITVRRNEDGDLTRKLSFILTENIEAKDRGNIFPKPIRNARYVGLHRRISEALVEF